MANVPCYAKFWTVRSDMLDVDRFYRYVLWRAFLVILVVNVVVGLGIWAGSQALAEPEPNTIEAPPNEPEPSQRDAAEDCQEQGGAWVQGFVVKNGWDVWRGGFCLPDELLKKSGR